MKVQIWHLVIDSGNGTDNFVFLSEEEVIKELECFVKNEWEHLLDPGPVPTVEEYFQDPHDNAWYTYGVTEFTIEELIEAGLKKFQMSEI